MPEHVNKRHAYLELKVRKGWELQRCLCGEHRDEKRELARYRRQARGEALSHMTPYERLTQLFGTLDQVARDKLLSEIT
jgi:hypothetical protein